MIERKIDYRGSKLVIYKSIPIKEQRVDGHWCVYLAHLRCTLMDFEKNYLIRMSSNHLTILRSYTSIRSYTSLIIPPLSNLNPWYLTGFSNASLTKKKFIRQYRKKALQPTVSAEKNNIVVWGTNLQSTVGERFSHKELAIIRLTSYTKSVIVGLILSDGWLTFASITHKNIRLGFKQSADRVAYVLFVFNLLSHYCSSGPSLVINNREGKTHYGLQFFRSMLCLTELYSLFYPNKVKIIPKDIYNLLTPIALAHLIMGDGSTRPHGLTICTNNYLLKDVVRLMNVLIIRYNLKCTLHLHKQNNKNGYEIYIKQQSMFLLRNIVSPYTHSVMSYKLNNKIAGK